MAEFRLALDAQSKQAAAQIQAAAEHGAGEAQQRLGLSLEARESFERAVALAPDNWRSRCHLGVLLTNEGRAEEARAQFLAALALPQVRPQAGAQPPAAWAELLNNLGVAQVLAGDLEAAVKTFSRAMQDARDPERSANNLGLLLVRLGRPAEALAAFRAGGNDARALNNLGYALYLQGDAPKAQALFEKALDLSPRYYETAGENLKQAVQGAAVVREADRPGDGFRRGVQGGVVRRALGADDFSGQGVSAPAAPDLLAAARISLSAPDASTQRFGQASLLGEAGQRRAY